MAAAVIISTIPGIALYFDGQCEGKRVKLPLQLGREPEEKPDEKIKEFYHKLLHITNAGIFRHGNWKILETSPVADNDYSYENLFAWEWRLNDELLIILTNYSNSAARCRLKLEVGSKTDEVVLSDLLNNTNYKRSLKEISEKGLFIELKSFNSHIFSFNETKLNQRLH